jgi:hypothetical protein
MKEFYDWNNCPKVSELGGAASFHIPTFHPILLTEKINNGDFTLRKGKYLFFCLSN